MAKKGLPEEGDVVMVECVAEEPKLICRVFKNVAGAGLNRDPCWRNTATQILRHGIAADIVRRQKRINFFSTARWSNQENAYGTE